MNTPGKSVVGMSTPVHPVATPLISGEFIFQQDSGLVHMALDTINFLPTYSLAKWPIKVFPGEIIS